MIDIEEAMRSLDYYAELLELQCDHYNVAVEPGSYLDVTCPARRLPTLKMK